MERTVCQMTQYATDILGCSPLAEMYLLHTSYSQMALYAFSNDLTSEVHIVTNIKIYLFVAYVMILSVTQTI
jgi:hypothetical protein